MRPSTSNPAQAFFQAHPVAVIAIAQLFGTSLWFSANSAADDLQLVWGISALEMGWLTSAVQIGFIVGTLTLALSGLADRYRASSIFIVSALAGALCNALFAWWADGLTSALVLRFLVGLSLAGIYPVGMKLIVSWAPDRTGAALAQLVAMLTLGTALPHLIRDIGANLSWQYIITASSLLAVCGALLISLLGDGPHLPQHSPRRSTDTSSAEARFAVLGAFRIRAFRAAAWGYFGHMWELYAFWTIVPLLITQTELAQHFTAIGASSMSFAVIAVGALGCLLGGVLSKRFGSARVALAALTCSGLCALLFVLFVDALPPLFLALLLLVWGAAVIADSPQFSALSAQACPPKMVGAALAFQNSIGFAITVVSITATSALFDVLQLNAAWLLIPGPLIGVLGFLLVTKGSKEAQPAN